MYQISGLSLKNCDREVPDRHTDGRTDIQTYIQRTKQGKPGRNGNSSQGSVLVSEHYWFVKQCWLENITGLYRVQISEKYRFLPQRFNLFLELRYTISEHCLVFLEESTLPPKFLIDAELEVKDIHPTSVLIHWRKFTPSELRFIDGIQLRYRNDTNAQVRSLNSSHQTLCQNF